MLIPFFNVELLFNLSGVSPVLDVSWILLCLCTDVPVLCLSHCCCKYRGDISGMNFRDVDNSRKPGKLPGCECESTTSFSKLFISFVYTFIAVLPELKGFQKLHSVQWLHHSHRIVHFASSMASSICTSCKTMWNNE